MTALRLSLILLACLLTAGCSIQPPLHLHEQAMTRIVLDAKVNVSVMWQAGWQAEWKFPWNTEAYGPLTYPDPASMRLHIYPLDVAGNPKSHSVNNFYGTSSEIPISVGIHDMIFHNNDSEVLLFNGDMDNEEIHCYTRVISSGLKEATPIQTVSQKSGTKASDDDFPEEPVTLMPDALLSDYVKACYISDDLADYEYIDGHYVLRIEGTLMPSSYIHLIQINLLNNYGRVVGSNGGVALTGLASGVDVRTRVSDNSSVSVITDARYNGETDQFGIRFLSFGIPGCNPYEAESVAAAPEGPHFLVLNVTYMDATWRNIRIDVTDAFRALPLGGVITLELDVDDFPPEHAYRGDGFDALIDDWEEVRGETTIIN